MVFTNNWLSSLLVTLVISGMSTNWNVNKCLQISRGGSYIAGHRKMLQSPPLNLEDSTLLKIIL